MEDLNATIIEVACTKGFSNKNSQKSLHGAIYECLQDHKNLPADQPIPITIPGIESVMLCKTISEKYPPKDIRTIMYVLNDGPAEQECISQSGDEVEIATHWILPAREFMGLWESLIYDEGLKQDLLNFAQTTMLFSRKNVNHNLISCNRLMLLHGPPGTGKTSLCQALAQKLAIRMTDKYTHSHLFEVNSHSLFSKWFSESGKLVQKVFSQIHELAQDRSALVCVLIDEVESIAFARETISNNEPSDSIRVVNAVLTQLDRLRGYPNVFVLATSNLTGSIDLAFLDRADIVQYIGHPNAAAIHEIYRSALVDLQNVGIITCQEAIPVFSDQSTTVVAEKLKALVEISAGLSGRSLRKVPFLAHALFVNLEATTLLKFISAMQSAVLRMQQDKKMLERSSKPLNGHAETNGSSEAAGKNHLV